MSPQPDTQTADSEISVSVVICAHTMDRIDALRAAIASVLVQEQPACDIIVVCDHNPELLALVAGEYPGVTVVANNATRGLSGARNTGLNLATGSVIAFLDDDATAEPDWLSMIARAYLDPKVIAAGGDITPVWPDRRPVWWPREFDWVIGCSYLGLPTTAGPVRNLIGCNMSIRSDVVRSIGGFRENLGRVGDNGAGCEETELFIRALEKFPGHVVQLDPEARVHHGIAPSRTRLQYFLARCRAEGRGKADMIRIVGKNSGLSSETTYVRKTLPAGIARGVRDAAKGDFAGLARAGTILLGFGSTAASYLVARARAPFRRPVTPPFQPFLITEVDVEKDLPDLQRIDAETGDLFGAAWVLVRAKEQPVRILELPFGDTDISGEDLAEAIRRDTTEVPPPPIPGATGATAPHVSVVIATRDRAESLKRCLESLMAQTYDNMDIVVVDNAPSSSETETLIAEAYEKTGKVTYVREDIPGLGRAHNSGFAAASGEVIAFTDDDVLVDSAWVASIAANFASSDRIGCVTGLILPAELQTRAQLWTERHGGFGKGLHRKVYDAGQSPAENPLFPYTAGAFGSGANMAFRRETLVKMGGFDNALGAGTLAKGGDDLAAFVAAIQAGYQLVYEPGAMVWHFHRRQEGGMRRQAFGYGFGLGAYLTKQIVDDPERLIFFVRKFPAAVRHIASPKSDKMARLPDDYPRWFVWSERLGILMGAPGYLRSLRATRRIDREQSSLVMAQAENPVKGQINH